MARKKIERARTKRKKQLDVLEQLLYILHLSQDFGKGMFPHQSNTPIRKCIEIYSRDENMRARAGNKSVYEYLLYLENFYSFCASAEAYSEHREDNIKNLNEVRTIKQEMEMSHVKD